MAIRAPFGTDLQAKFDVRVVAGKLIHTPLLASKENKKQPLSRNKTKDSSISGAVQAHRHLKQAQGHATMDSQRDGVGRPRSKRARSLDILPILEEGAGAVEALEEPSPLKVANTAQAKASSRSKTKVSLPNIMLQSPNNKQFSTASDAPTAQLRMKELHTLVEALFKPVVNKISIMEDIRQSCNRADNAYFGVLSKDVVLNTFKSHGVKVTERDLSKLCRLIPCSMGEDHIQHVKLCTGLENTLRKTYSIRDNSPTTPLGSIGSESPDSFVDYDDFGYSLPVLKDRTNAFQRSLPLEDQLLFHKPRTSRSLSVHPLSLSHNKNTARLPRLSEVSSNLNKVTSTLPQTKTAHVCRLNTEAPCPLEEEQENGVDKMFNALRSCTDSDGK